LAYPEGDRSRFTIKIGAPGIATMLVPEGAPRRRIHRRVPGGVELAVGAGSGVLVMDVRGAGITGTRYPDPEGAGPDDDSGLAGPSLL
jgi:hypothetical protein